MSRPGTEWRRLGGSEVTVPPLSLGTAPLGNLYSEVPEEVAYETLRRALRLGLAYVDTAPHYGLGLAERRLGQILGDLPRESFVLATKVGRLLRPAAAGEYVDPEAYVTAPSPSRPYKRVWDFSRDGVRRSIEESLQRLGLDRVDIAYLHDPDEHEREVFETGYPALAELRDEGVVGAIGAGMNQARMLTRFVRETDVDAVLCAGRYTLLDHTARQELLPACLERGTSVVIGGVYNSGLLADPRPGAPFDYAPAPAGLVGRARQLGATCQRYGVPLRAAAMRFPAAHPAVATVLIGARSPEEVEDGVAMAAYDVPQALWDGLRAAEQLPADVPVPAEVRP